MFLLYYIIIFLVFIFLIFLFFSIKIKIDFKNYVLSIPKADSKNIEKNEVKIKLYILGKIRIMDRNLTKLDFYNKKIDKEIEKVKKSIFSKENKISLNIGKSIERLGLEFEKGELNIILGLEDAALTGISVGILAIVLGNIFSKEQYRNVKYKINPIYENRNFLNIRFKGIIVFNLRNIINIIFEFNKKGRVNKNDRTSNRRPYVYSNE